MPVKDFRVVEFLDENLVAVVHHSWIVKPPDANDMVSFNFVIFVRVKTKWNHF